MDDVYRISFKPLIKPERVDDHARVIGDHFLVVVRQYGQIRADIAGEAFPRADETGRETLAAWQQHHRHAVSAAGQGAGETGQEWTHVACRRFSGVLG